MTPTSDSEECDILLVDDNEALRDLLATYLRANGYAVQCADNGNDALLWLQRVRARLIITDIFMPGSDGIELILGLRARGRRIPIVTMSGDGVLDSELFLKMAGQFGARRTLAKPFALEVMLAVVRQELESVGL